jgi:catechol 2,3-dioxygenase-like lactoylglutathione lyase family enzyme
MPPKPPKKILPPKPSFASVAVVVSDRKKALDWYTKTLGLDIIDNKDHWVTVGKKGRPGALHLCEWAEVDPNGKLEPGNSGILLLLPGKDFRESCGALKAHGVPFAQEPQTESWGSFAVIRDPDGNEHMLMPEG